MTTQQYISFCPQSEVERVRTDFLHLKRYLDDYTLRLRKIKEVIQDLKCELKMYKPKKIKTPRIYGESQFEFLNIKYKSIIEATEVSDYLIKSYENILHNYGFYVAKSKPIEANVKSKKNLLFKPNLTANDIIVKNLTLGFQTPKNSVRTSFFAKNNKLPDIVVNHLNTKNEATNLAEVNKELRNVKKVQDIIFRFFNTLDNKKIKQKLKNLQKQNKIMDEEEKTLSATVKSLENDCIALQQAVDHVNSDIKGYQRMIQEGTDLFFGQKEKICEVQQNIKEILIQNRMMTKSARRIGSLFELDIPVECNDVDLCRDIFQTIVDLFKKSPDLLYLVKNIRLGRTSKIVGNFQIVDSTSSSRRLLSGNDFQQSQQSNSPFKSSHFDNNGNDPPSITALASSSNIPLNTLSASGSSIAIPPLSSNNNLMVPGLALGSINFGSSSNLLLPGISLSSAKGTSEYFPLTRSTRRVFSAMNSMRVSEASQDDVDQEFQMIGTTIGHMFVQRFSPQLHQLKIQNCVLMEYDDVLLKSDERLESNLESYSAKKILNTLFDLYKRFRAYLFLLMFDDWEIKQSDQSFFDFISKRNQIIESFSKCYDNDVLMKEFSFMLNTDESSAIWLMRDLILMTEAVEIIPIIYQTISQIFQRKQSQITPTIDSEYATLFVPWAAIISTMLSIRQHPSLEQNFTVICNNENICKIIPVLSCLKNSSSSRAGITAFLQLGCFVPHLFHTVITLQNKATSFIHNFLRSSLNFPTCVKASTDIFNACHRYLDDETVMWHTALFYDMIIHELVRVPIREVNLNSYLSVMTVIVANRQKFTMDQLGKLYFLSFLIDIFHLEELIKNNANEKQEEVNNDNESNTQNNDTSNNQVLQNPENEIQQSEDVNSQNNSQPDNKKPFISMLPLNTSNKKVSYLDLPKLSLPFKLPSLNLENPKLQLHFQPTADQSQQQKNKSNNITTADYLKMRSKYPVYITKEVHIHFVQLMFATLIDHSLHRLDVFFCDPFPQVNRKPNVLYTLMKHMESKYNEDISDQMEEVFTPPPMEAEVKAALSSTSIGLVPLSSSINNSRTNLLETSPKSSGYKLEKSNSLVNKNANIILESVAEEGTTVNNVISEELEDTFSIEPAQAPLGNIPLMSFKSMPSFIAAASDEDIIESTLRNSSREELVTRYEEDTRSQYQDYLRLLRMTVPYLFHPEGYSNGQHIASGAFGAVMAVTIENTLFAVKVLEKSRNELDNPHLIEVYTEVSILEVCKGDRRVTQLIDYGCTTDSYYIVQEFYPSTMKGWRKKYLQRNEKPPEDMLLRLYREFLRACTVLTDHRINHFDIKCDNVMLDKDGYPALADFGEAMCYKNEMNCFTMLNKGTEWIKSPEMLSIALNSSTTNPNYDRRKRVGAGPASDIWSIGCLFFELITGEFLFLDSDWSRFFLRITDPKKELLNEDNLALLDHNKKYITFLEFVLQRSVRHRPDLQQVIVKFDEMFPDAMKGPLPKLEMPVFQVPDP